MITNLRLFVACAIASGWLYACPLPQEPQAPSPAVAPGAVKIDSNYADMEKDPSTEVQNDIEKYLRECELVRGINPNGLWVQTGIADIKRAAGTSGWGESRKFAFDEALKNAQVELIKAIGVANSVIRVSELAGNMLDNPKEVPKPEDYRARMQSKLEALGEATLDNALKDANVKVPPAEKVSKKVQLFLENIQKKSDMKAIGDVSGFYAMSTFEAGNIVGVVIGRRPESLGWVSVVAKGGGAQGVPRGEPGRSLADRIPNDPKVLSDRFGVRVVTDENGQICVIAYGQSSPNITQGLSPQRKKQMLQLARADASLDALNALTSFLQTSLMYQGEQDQAQNEQTNRIESEVAGVPMTREMTREEIVYNMVKNLDTKSKSISTAFVVGATKFLEWQGNHPEYGNPLVGHVLVWTPTSAAAAGQFNNATVPSKGEPGFVPTGPKPGVRRSSGEDKPSGRGEEKPVAESAAPQAASGPCEGTEAVGEGADLRSATLDALENAVRQSCGLSLSSSTTAKSRSESSIVDVRVNEACAEMKEAFTASSLMERDVGVRTKGMVSSYTVLSEERVSASVMRLRICAKVPQFDPKNPRPGAKPTLIVLTPTSRQASYNCFGSNISSSDVIRCLETEMARDLFKIKAFTILERERLAAILGEQAFIASDLTKIQEKAKLGIFSGGDLILLSEIEDLMAAQDEKVIKLTGNRVVKRYGTAKVNWRIVSVGTGEIIDQDTVNLPLDDEAFRQLGSKYPSTQVAAALMSLVSARIAPDVASRAAPLRVAQVVGGTVFLNRGRETLKPGMEFAVYRQGVEMHDPNTGASLGRSESKIGMVKVERCEQDFSTAIIISGEIGTQDASSMCRTGS